MTTVVSLESVLRDKVKELGELKLATVLLTHKATLKEQLLQANHDMIEITRGINVMKHDLQILKEQNEHCRNLAISFRELDRRIMRIEENLPAQVVQDFTQLNAEVSPYEETSANRSVIPNNNDTVEKTLIRQVEDMNIDTPQHRIEDCKKTLFRNTEDSYMMDLLTNEEFAKIPKYMIGRQSMATLNEFITTINTVLEAKYSVLALGKNGARKKGKLDLYLNLKCNEIVVAPGEVPIYFFTAEDFHRHTQTKLDKTKLNLLTVLRHCKRLRELRVGKNLQYIIIPT